MTKICNTCNQEKSLLNFNRDRAKKDGFHHLCKDCRRQYKKKYDLNHKVKIKVDSILYYSKNKERIKNQVEQYALTHREEIKLYPSRQDKAKKSIQDKSYRLRNKERINTYTRRKKQESIPFKLSCALRVRLGDAIKKSEKQISSIKELGCSVRYLKNYLEQKFHDHPSTGLPMTWENWGKGPGKWQIDHIIEFQEIDLDNHQDLQKVCDYKNLQPLWHEEHIIKTLNTIKKVREIHGCIK